MFLVATELPEDMPSEPLFGCIFGPEDDPTDVATGYRGTVHVDSENYNETQFLRIFVHAPKSAEAPDPEASLERVIAPRVDPGSEYETEVSGREAIGFTVSTAEPVLTPWPAVAWEQDSLLVWMIGEGFDRSSFDAAANSLVGVSRDEYLSTAVRSDC